MFANRYRKTFNPFGVEIGKITETNEDLAFWQSQAARNIITKQPSTDVKKSYQMNLERAFTVALGLTVVCLIGLRAWGFQAKTIITPKFEFVVEQIPPTEQFKRPPAPERPSVALPSDDEDIPDDVTIAAAEIDFTEIPSAPPPPEATDESTDIFIEYDSPPEPVGGFAEIYKNLAYPRLARKAGLEALVLVQVLVDAVGNIENVKILKDSGTKIGFEKAAMNAVKDVKWKPAMQRDKPVRVAVTIPIRFKLTSNISS